MQEKIVVEKRQYGRFPLPLIKPIKIHIGSLKEEVAAIMVNISAGGLGLLSFIHIPLNTNLILGLNFKGLKIKKIRSKVVWVKQKENTFQIGIKFTSIPNTFKNKIYKMAEDFDICEKKILLGLKDVCYKKCSYYLLCSKPLKIKKF